MERTFKGFVLLALVVLFFNSCAALSPSLSSRHISLIRIDTDLEEDSVPELRPGESLELKATVLDRNGKKIDFSPLWKADIGIIEPHGVKRVTYTVPEDAQTGMVFITAKAGDISDTLIIEIQR